MVLLIQAKVSIHLRVMHSTINGAKSPCFIAYICLDVSRQMPEPENISVSLTYVLV